MTLNFKIIKIAVANQDNRKHHLFVNRTTKHTQFYSFPYQTSRSQTTYKMHPLLAPKNKERNVKHMGYMFAFPKWNLQCQNL